MVKFQTRVMVAIFVLVDVAVHRRWPGSLAFFLRFHSDLVAGYLPVTKGVPALSPLPPAAAR